MTRAMAGDARDPSVDASGPGMDASGPAVDLSRSGAAETVAAEPAERELGVADPDLAETVDAGPVVADPDPADTDDPDPGRAVPFAIVTQPVVVDASFAVEAMLEGGACLDAWTSWAREGRMRLVPPHFWAELANALLLGRRLEPGRTALLVGATSRAGIETADRGVAGVAGAVDLASRHRLTVYDALYLHLALDVDGELATLDRDLARAARSEGVGLAIAS